uniref:Actinoporin-like protein n=1 Tax=Sinocyclocheilus anshuiensis TaxID=1608454 RepID=A0A671RI59_9TELE
MTESAEAAAANVSSKRHATIEITNLTNNYCLLNPKVYLESGETSNPPQPTVAQATGCVGVMTYDLFERSRNDYTETLAVMFSVLWDYSLYKNWFAVGIYPKGKEYDQALYKEMYYQKNPQGLVTFLTCPYMLSPVSKIEHASEDCSTITKIKTSLF